MRAHYLQHVPFEGLGSIEPWLKNRGYDITCTPFFSHDRLPEINRVDLLVVMGGPMSVNDEEVYPWLHKEKEFIREAVKAQIPVLGICLGAQLIASALDARVYPHGQKEIGWFPVQGVSHSEKSHFHFPEQALVFHWHGETFDLPAGAVQLARSEACENQAFQLGDRIIGLQFHLETTPVSAAAIVEHCGDELIDGAFVQNERDILGATPEKFEHINTLMEALLAFLESQR